MSTRHAPALDLPARFMALSMLSFVTLVVLAPWTLPMLQGHFNDIELLALIHLVTLGFVGSMLIGASYQLVPVVLQSELVSVEAARFSFWFYAAGLGFFLYGLVQVWLPGLAVGGTMLGVAFTIYATTIFVTWLRSGRRDVVSWHIVLGVLGSVMGMSMGVVLAFNKSNGMLGSSLLGFIGSHASFMLGGWILVMLTGVSYRLVCMFTLAEKHFRPWLAWLELAAVMAGSWTIATALHLHWPREVIAAAAVVLLLGVVCFAVQIGLLFWHRLRRGVDIWVPFLGASIGMMLMVPLLVAIGMNRHALPTDPIWVAVLWLALVGVAGTAIQGFFFKISSFLVWLKRYAPIAGRQKVPTLESLYSRPLALSGGALWILTVWAGAVVILLDRPWLPFVGVAMCLAGLMFVANVVRVGRHWWRGDRLDLREPVVPRQPHLIRRSGPVNVART